jgi:hypothetical protein
MGDARSAGHGRREERRPWATRGAPAMSDARSAGHERREERRPWATRGAPAVGDARSAFGESLDRSAIEFPRKGRSARVALHVSGELRKIAEEL